VAATVTEPSPLVLDFHGYGGTGEGDVGTLGLVEATAGGATLLYPDGVPQDWYENAVGWDTRSNDTTDIHFAQALIDYALAEHCVDTTRIYAVGFSWGGWMSNQVACALGDQIRGFLSVAGGGPSGQCLTSVGAMIVHGQADSAEPIVAGEESFSRWTQTNGCGADASATDPSPCVGQNGCNEPVLWCEHAGGHDVPQFVYDGAWPFLMSL
jgi:polyhydroxybutyrate depolymerase